MPVALDEAQAGRRGDRLKKNVEELSRLRRLKSKFIGFSKLSGWLPTRGIKRWPEPQ